MAMHFSFAIQLREHRPSESFCFLALHFGNAPRFILLWAKSNLGDTWRGGELAH